MRALLFLTCFAFVGAFACNDRSDSAPTQANKPVKTDVDTAKEQIEDKAEEIADKAGDELEQASDDLQRATADAVAAANQKIADLEARVADVDDEARESYDEAVARLKQRRDEMARNANDARTTTKASLDLALEELETQYNKALEALQTDN